MNNYIKMSLFAVVAISAIVFGMNFYAGEENQAAINNATSSNTPNTIVKRDPSGSFSAGTITANLVGNVTGNATTANSAQSFTGMLAGDVNGTQDATIVSSVGGVSAANIAAATDYYVREVRGRRNR